jgi:hypothetical protein
MHEVRVESLEKLESREGRMLLSGGPAGGTFMPILPGDNLCRS